MTFRPPSASRTVRRHPARADPCTFSTPRRSLSRSTRPFRQRRPAHRRTTMATKLQARSQTRSSKRCLATCSRTSTLLIARTSALMRRLRGSQLTSETRRARSTARRRRSSSGGSLGVGSSRRPGHPSTPAQPRRASRISLSSPVSVRERILHRPPALTPHRAGEDERFSFKRAVSRVHEMSSAEYLVTAVHQPLPAHVRSWETPSAAATAATTAALSPARHAVGEKAPLPSGRDDLLSGVLEPSDLRAKWPEGRPASEKEVDVRQKPVLREEHVWGVREDWGKKAGKWGQGAKAYEKE